jgi:ADP-ribose pyrophosphatase YjhB (NUDIX family)
MSVKEIPEGGMCLSTFLVLSEKGNRSKVLLGRLNPSSAWDHIGALDPARASIHSKGWMLPSSHLIIYESPQEAASRILREQLELGDVELSEPKVVSEVYTPKRFQNLPSHWDIEFIFRGELDAQKLKRTSAWTELEFLDLRNIQPGEMARSHEDILNSVGFQLTN